MLKYEHREKKVFGGFSHLKNLSMLKFDLFNSDGGLSFSHLKNLSMLKYD